MNHKTKDILERIEDSSPNESSHEMFCRLRDCAREIEALRTALAGQSAGVPEDLIDDVSLALRKAWQLGQTYWQQADSESWTLQDKSGETQRKFGELVDETRAAIAAAPAPVSEPEQPSQDEANLCERIIHAVEGECDGLAITEEQAWNILAYLQYGAPICDMPEAFRLVDNAIGAAEEYQPEDGNLRIVTLRIDAARKVRAALASQTAEQPSECGEPGAPPSADHIADDRKLVDAPSAPTLGEPQWPSDRDAAIQACALMILGICKTEPQEVWPKRIEGRIRYMLSKLQPQAAEPKGLTEAIEALQCPETHSCSNPELFERGWEIGRGAALDIVRALLAKGD